MRPRLRVCSGHELATLDDVEEEGVPRGAVVGLLAKASASAKSMLTGSNVLPLPVATLYRWRSSGYGPPSHRVGRHIRYRPDEVERWVRRQS